MKLPVWLLITVALALPLGMIWACATHNIALFLPTFSGMRLWSLVEDKDAKSSAVHAAIGVMVWSLTLVLIPIWWH